MRSPLISCIVPVYNGERYLPETLDSILAETYRPIEIIVVDDGSTDRTPEIAGSYRRQLIYLRQDNSGPAAARNLGLRSAHGEFIAFLDADDLWHPQKLQRQMNRFEARSDLQGSITFMHNFWMPELTHEAARFYGSSLAKPVVGYHLDSLLACRSLFDIVGPFNPELRHADKTEWFLRAAERRVVIEPLPDILAFRRLHAGNMSRAESNDSWQEYLHLLKAKIDRERTQRHP